MFQYLKLISMSYAQILKIQKLEKIAESLQHSSSDKIVINIMKQSGLLPSDCTRYEYVVSITPKKQLILIGIDCFKNNKSNFVEVPKSLQRLYSILIYNELTIKEKMLLKKQYGIQRIKL